MTSPSSYPRISIVTPNFNCGSHLEETIKSIIGQNYPNLQYIVIDGGSTDNSVDIIKRYQKHIDYWLSEPDQGPANAISKGFAMADGEWINWLNSDDYLLPDALNILARVIAVSPGAKWVTGSRIVVNEQGGGLQHSGQWYRQGFYHLVRDVRLAQECTFLRRDFYTEIGGVNQECGSIFDRELYLRMMSRTYPVYTTAVFGVIRRRRGQLSLDETVRSGDYPILARIYDSQPLWIKLLQRLSCTRVHRWVTEGIDLLFRLGLIPRARRLKVVIFDETSFKWIAVRYTRGGF